MPYKLNYTREKKISASDLRIWAINEDKVVSFVTKDGIPFTMNILDRWSTYTEAERQAFKKIINDTLNYGENAEQGVAIDSVSGDF